MVGSNITSLREKFNSEIEKSFDLIKVINNTELQLQQKYVFLIVELSFLKIYLAWEQFLEETFISYIMGEKTSRGYKVSSYVFPRDFLHAQELINEGREYSNWAPDETLRKACRFFKEDPYRNALRPITQQLNDMKCIRNRIAHGSYHSSERFKTLVRSKISYVPSGITAGEFLFEMESKTKKTFFEFYISFLVDASKKIVP